MSETGPLTVSSEYEGGKLKFVGSGLLLRDFGEFWTGDSGANFGEFKVAGGGVGNGTLVGILPAAAFFSI